MTLNEADQQTAEQKETEAVYAWFQQVRHILQEQFAEFQVEGQMGQHPLNGPIFAYTLNKDETSYGCGFFLTELIRNFQSKENPVPWLTSYYVDLIRSGTSKPLPSPPQTEDEAKELIDKHIVPHCVKSAREEFPDESIHLDLEYNEDHGPVLEAGFPSIKEGNNTCAIPLHFLMTLHSLNRDSAEPLLDAMHQLKEQQSG